MIVLHLINPIPPFPRPVFSLLSSGFSALPLVWVDSLAARQLDEWFDSLAGVWVDSLAARSVDTFPSVPLR